MILDPGSAAAGGGKGGRLVAVGLLAIAIGLGGMALGQRWVAAVSAEEDEAAWELELQEVDLQEADDDEWVDDWEDELADECDVDASDEPVEPESEEPDRTLR